MGLILIFTNRHKQQRKIPNQNLEQSDFSILNQNTFYRSGAPSITDSLHTRIESNNVTMNPPNYHYSERQNSFNTNELNTISLLGLARDAKAIRDDVATCWAYL